MFAFQSQNLLFFKLHHADRTKLSVYCHKGVGYFGISSSFGRDWHTWQYVAGIDQKLNEFLVILERFLLEIKLDFLDIFLVCKQSLLFLPKCLLFCCFSQPIEMSAHQYKKKQEKNGWTCRIGDSIYILLNIPFRYLKCAIVTCLLVLTLTIYRCIATNSINLKTIFLAKEIAGHAGFVKLIIFNICKMCVICVEVDTLHDEYGYASQEEGEECSDECDELGFVGLILLHAY